MQTKKKGGRKPISDRSQVKVQFPIYIKQALIDQHGIDGLRQKLVEYAEKL